MNLLLNAVQACSEGGSVRVEFASDEKMVTASVIDTGKGIPPAVLPNIFRPFFTTKGERHRTGALAGAPHRGRSRRTAGSDQRAGQGQLFHIEPFRKSDRESEIGLPGIHECLHPLCDSVITLKSRFLSN